MIAVGRVRWWTVATALLVAVTLQALRATFAALGAAPFPGIAAVAVLAVPLLATLAARWLVRPAALLVLVALQAVAVAVAVLQDPPTLAAAGTASVLGLVALAAALARPDGERGGRAARALLLGLVVDAAVRGGLVTWNPLAAAGSAATVLTLLLPVLAVVAAALSVPTPTHPGRVPTSPAWSVVAVGPWLLLQVYFLASPAYVAATGGLGFEVSTLVVLVGLVLAWLVAAFDPRRRVGLLLGAALVAVAYVLPLPRAPLPGWVTVALVLAGQSLATPLLGRALRGRPDDDVGTWRAGLRAAVGIGAVGLLVGALAALERWPDAAPLSLPGPALTVAAALVLLVTAIPDDGREAVAGATPVRWLGWGLAVPLAALAVPLLVLLARGDVAPVPFVGGAAGGPSVAPLQGSG